MRSNGHTARGDIAPPNGLSLRVVSRDRLPGGGRSPWMWLVISSPGIRERLKLGRTRPSEPQARRIRFREVENPATGPALPLEQLGDLVRGEFRGNSPVGHAAGTGDRSKPPLSRWS